ncbi:hypothetical protein, partial [Vibrio sp. M260118]|uniref:hypothetical protein n=1 Tax=Vibrio sp. M260118 TaxID=3020896 RepID=UPI002F3EAECB
RNSRGKNLLGTLPIFGKREGKLHYLIYFVNSSWGKSPTLQARYTPSETLKMENLRIENGGKD